MYNYRISVEVDRPQNYIIVNLWVLQPVNMANQFFHRRYFEKLFLQLEQHTASKLNRTASK